MDTKTVKILYLGTPDISAFVLEALIHAGYNIIGIISQEDKETDRKGNIIPTATKQIGLKHNIKVYQFDKIRLHVEEVKAIAPELILTMAYGQIVPQAILDIPKYGCINLHGSILPKYRGAAPIQAAILNGETRTGFTLMQMIDKMDAGLMYATKEVTIENEDNYSTLLDKMKICARDLILETLDSYLLGKLTGTPQDEMQVSFANKIKKEDEKISLDLSAINIINKVRALAEEPGAHLILDNEIIKIYKIHLFSDEAKHSLGEIIEADKKGLLFQAKDGVIAIDILQKQQKKKMTYLDFVNGCHGLVGKIFE
jgi:methionyl-tRNA formyltransferase